MNYLAHAYLSFGIPDLLLGNMISDFVKGKSNKEKYSSSIQFGITLHRSIDSFTDVHPATKAAKDILRPDYRLFSAPMIDIIFDHFLANDPNEFSNKAALQEFTVSVYDTLSHYQAIFPEMFTPIFHAMTTQNWLFNYQHKYGVRKSLNGLAKRSAYLNSTQKAYQLFEEYYEELRQCYQNFFPDVKKYAFDHIQPFYKEYSQ